MCIDLATMAMNRNKDEFGRDESLRDAWRARQIVGGDAQRSASSSPESQVYTDPGILIDPVERQSFMELLKPRL